MKIGIISDLHIDLNDRARWSIIPALAEICIEKRVSTLLIAGDLSNNFTKTLEILQRIEELCKVKCIFVPGNHDIWNVHHQNMTGWEVYQALQHFPGNLARGPVFLNEEWVVIGDLGWYDYSFGNPQFTTHEFDAMEHEKMLWQDRIFANWGQSTQEVSRIFYQKLKEQLEQFKDKKMILMTHIVPHADFIVRSNKAIWQYFNAFLGSDAYGELAVYYGVQYYVFGHVHYRMRREISGVNFICNSLGYTREWWNPTDPREEVRRAFITIEI